jgi:hypothetical protein
MYWLPIERASQCGTPVPVKMKLPHCPAYTGPKGFVTILVLASMTGRFYRLPWGVGVWKDQDRSQRR